MERIPLRYFRF